MKALRRPVFSTEALGGAGRRSRESRVVDDWNTAEYQRYDDSCASRWLNNALLVVLVVIFVKVRITIEQVL